MAGQPGRSTAVIEQDLLENGPAYDYFQAVRLIGLLARQNRGKASGYEVRIRPELSFNYPAADISAISRLEDDRGFAITTTFMGLYGVSSPLPAFFTDELLDDEWEEVSAPRGFLDVIHQHLYPLLYEAWMKHKFSHGAVENGDESYWHILYSLVGLGMEEIRAAITQPRTLLRYAGLLAQQRKSAVGLHTILQDLLAPFDVDIEPCVTRVVNIPESQRLRLGDSQYQLGDSAVIGHEMLDRMGKVIIRIGPLESDEYKNLVAERTRLDTVRMMVKLYLLQPLDFELILSLKPQAKSGVSLGESMWSCLGVDSWMSPYGNADSIDISYGAHSQA